MSRYIEFVTKSPHSDFTYDSPVHNGQMPTRYFPVKGVTVDGIPVTFEDPDTPDRLHCTIRKGDQISKTNPFDCVIFALLMADVNIYDFIGKGDIKFTATRHASTEEDPPIDGDIIDLGSYRGGGDEPTFIHTISAAPTEEMASYLHKLGSGGPVCFSSLEAAQKIYRAPIAKKLVGFTLEAPGQETRLYEL